MIPFMIDVMESAHQIPLRPIRPPNIIASGILALVKAMLMILQSLVLPSPDIQRPLQLLSVRGKKYLRLPSESR